MFPSIGTETMSYDYSGDVDAHIPLLSLEGAHTWFRPPPRSSTASQESSSQSSSSRGTSVASVANYKTIATPETTSVMSHNSADVQIEREGEKKYETLLMSLWGAIYFSTLLVGISLLIWGCLSGRVWPKVVGGVFVGLHTLVCVGMVVVEAHFDGMEAEIQVEV